MKKGETKKYDFNLKGSQVANILNPVRGYRGQLEREGKTPKNHLRTNYFVLKQKEKEFREKQIENKDQLESQKKKESLKLRRFRNVKSRFSESSSSNPRLSLDCKENTSVNQNFVQRNKNQIQVKPSKPALPTRHTPQHQLGHIPKYLKKLRDQKKHLQGTRNLSPPSNMILLDERERMDTLHKLQRDLSTLLHDQAKLPSVPASCDLDPARHELQQKIQETQDAVRIFSRPRVFVPKE